jgi:hypothetical protein
MSKDHALIPGHPPGEQPLVESVMAGPVPVGIHAGRIDMERDPDAAVTLLGPLPFFVEYLRQPGLFDSS